jgi:hypothetical protein
VRTSLSFSLAALVLLPEAQARAGPCEPDPAAAADAPIAMRDFAGQLGARIDACATAARSADASSFCARHALVCTPQRERDYVTMRTLFELARDGGPWRLRWAITNRDPTAKHIWAAWQAAPPALASKAASATAECDELSALYAGLSRRLGVRGVGLFWPTSNHTIAAWEAAPGVRVLVPTSQIFLSCDATFDDTAFSPTKQRKVFEFPARDVPDRFMLPAGLTTFLLDQVTHYAGASLEILGALRLHRAIALGSSVPASCGGGAAGHARGAEARGLTGGDRRALLRYAATELGLTTSSAEEVLAQIAR